MDITVQLNDMTCTSRAQSAIHSGGGLKCGQQTLFLHFRSRFPYARVVFCWRVVPFAMTRKRPSDSEKARPSNSFKGASSAVVIPHAKFGSGQRVREILARKNMSLFQMSQASRRLFAGEPRYHIPHNLYFDLRNERFTPSIHQLIALSSVSGYRLTDWLSVFGFQLDDISRLQVDLPFPRTILLDSNVYDNQTLTPWFEERRAVPQATRIVPLIQLLHPSVMHRVATLLRMNRASFVYAKVGPQDVFAFPELLPGSVVRADPRTVQSALASISSRTSQPLFLVEHAGGLNCCHLQHLAADRVALVPTELPCARVELQLGRELNILGTIDMEVRNVRKMRRSEDCRAFEESKKQDDTPFQLSNPELHHLLRSGRLRAGLSFRQASALSRKIAEQLGDERYFTAAGSLSDYEASNMPPRHIQKIVTICTLYSIDFWQFLKAARLPLEKLGQEVISDGLAASPQSPELSRSAQLGHKEEGEGVFLRNLFEQFQEIPFFLRNSLPAISGLPRLSLRDVFWVGGGEHGFHQFLEGTQFLVVNRRTKKPAPLKWEPLWKQPLYLLTRRDGSFFCGSFILEGKLTVLHPLSKGLPGPEPTHTGVDTEIVGQIVTVVRRIPART
jgi:transcriptional regulator with XRE-family HTH domain